MRLGFGTNLVLDGLFIAAHLTVGTVIIRYGSPARGSSSRPPVGRAKGGPER